MKKLVAVLGVLLVPAAFLVGPAGAGDERTATAPVEVVGAPVEGTDLTVVPADWEAVPDTRGYEWLRDGEGDVLSTGSTYTTSDADVGHTLVVVERVTFGTRRDETSSAPVEVAGPDEPYVPADPINPDGPDGQPAPADQTPLTSPSAAVTGSPVVGRKLRVDLAGGTPGSSTAVQWQRDGIDVAGASGATYVVTRADAGRTMTVRTTSTMAGRAPVAGTSTGRNVAAVNTRRPTLKGTAKVGKRLSARSKGTWFAPAHSYRYQWLRGGKVVKGATKTSYRLTTKDRRKKVSVRVSVRRPGFATVSRNSSSKRIK